jgi:hypothetical protein
VSELFRLTGAAAAHQSFDILIVAFHVFFGVFALLTQIILCFAGHLDKHCAPKKLQSLLWS